MGDHCWHLTLHLPGSHVIASPLVANFRRHIYPPWLYTIRAHRWLRYAASLRLNLLMRVSWGDDTLPY